MEDKTGTIRHNLIAGLGPDGNVRAVQVDDDGNLISSGGGGATPPIDTSDLAKDQTLEEISNKIDILEAGIEEIRANFFSTTTTLGNLTYINNLLGDKTDELAPDSEGFHTLASLIKRISSLLEISSSGAEPSILATYNFDPFSAPGYSKLETNSSFQGADASVTHGGLSASYASYSYLALTLTQFTNQGCRGGINIKSQIKAPFTCRFSVIHFLPSFFPDNSYVELGLHKIPDYVIGQDDNSVFSEGSFGASVGIRLIKQGTNLIPVCFVSNSPASNSLSKAGDAIALSSIRTDWAYFDISISSFGVVFSIYQNDVKKDLAIFRDWLPDVSEYTAYAYLTSNNQTFTNNDTNGYVFGIREIAFLTPAPTFSDQETSTYNYVTDAGTISKGAKKIYIANVGNANGTIQTKPLPPGISIPFEATQGNILGAIPYDATGTQFAIVEVR